MQRIGFIHIPKTAGATLRSIIQRNYSLRELYPMDTERARTAFQQMPEETKDRIKVVYGHFCMDVASWLPGDLVFISMLRDPIERTISSYYYERYVRKTEPAVSLPLRAFIQQGGYLPGDNWMVRCFSGASESVPFGRCTPQMLEAAKSAADRFALIGLSERFDESYAMLCQMFGWRVRYASARNINPHRTPLGDSSPEDIACIEQHNRFDIAFYDYCARRLEQQLADTNIAPQLRELKRRRESTWCRMLDAYSQTAIGRSRRVAKTLFGMRQFG